MFAALKNSNLIIVEYTFFNFRASKSPLFLRSVRKTSEREIVREVGREGRKERVRKRR